NPLRNQKLVNGLSPGLAHCGVLPHRLHVRHARHGTAMKQVPCRGRDRLGEALTSSSPRRRREGAEQACFNATGSPPPTKALEGRLFAGTTSGLYFHDWSGAMLCESKRPFAVAM